MVTVLLANDQTYLTKDHPGPARDGGPIVIIGVACIAVAAVAGAVAYLFRNS